MDQIPIPDPVAGGELVELRREPLTPRTDEDDPRTNFDSDYDKLQYAEALRRLEYVTQVVPAGTGHHYHSRAVHTHKVAQVARAVANRLLHSARNDRGGWTAAEKHDLIERFGGLDPVVAAAGALVHDFGHPPFGHAGERGLDRMAKRVWGITDESGSQLSFEGNAQSFRIIQELEQHQHDNEGLALTHATINASLKYPWSMATGLKKYGAYESEREKMMVARAYVRQQLGARRTMEAQIVDLSDDVSYAVHDVEDFYRVGLIPLHEFLIPGSRREDELVAAILSSWNEQILDVARHTVGPEEVQELSVDELLTLSPDGIPEPRRDGVVQARRVVGPIPSADRVRIVLRQQLNMASPLHPFDGDSKSVGAVRAFAAKMIGFLLGEIEFSDDVGARFSESGRILVLGLKWMATHYVFEDARLREMQAAERRRLDLVGDHYAGLLGLLLRPAHVDENTCKYLGESIEAQYLTRIVDKYGRTPEEILDSPVPPTWPPRFQSRFRDVIVEDLPFALLAEQPPATEETGGGRRPAAADEASRRRRARLLIDALASLSESEVDELFESLRDARPRRSPILGQR